MCSYISSLGAGAAATSRMVGARSDLKINTGLPRNSWDTFRGDLNETELIGIAKSMEPLKAAGY